MNPKAFVSYSWTSSEHESWVIKLSTELREVGVDVTLDKWDLREGHDAIAFMEQMVTDAEIKVILVCDRKYAEKTDGRTGGVGTEAQIITPAIYAKGDQNKFVAVTTEISSDGKPFLPTYYKSRIYIDLSSNEVYAQNFEQLVRWIYDKPVYEKPALGKAPSFLAENDRPKLANAALHRRALEAIKNARPYAKGTIDEYLESCVSGLEAFRISGGEDDFDEKVVKSIDDFLPYRAQMVELFIALAQYRDAPETYQQLHRFFEQLLPLFYAPEGMTSYRTWDFDNFKFIAHELFLHLIAILLRYECFALAAHMMRQPYYLPKNWRDGNSAVVSFTTFVTRLDSLEHRKSRIKADRYSLHADLLEMRSHASGVDMQHLMQADFLLFIRASLEALRGTNDRWCPKTLVYCPEYSRPFEIFARARSTKYFANIAALLDIEGKDDLGAVLEAFRCRTLTTQLWPGHYIYPSNLLAFDKLSTMP